MNRYTVKGLIFGLTAISLTVAQVDFKADVINFRDATKQNMHTTHHGGLDVNSSTSGIAVNHTGTSAADYVAVSGRSVPVQFYGIGGSFEGGYMGVRGMTSIIGAGTRYAGYFGSTAAPTTGNIITNYGLYSYAASGTNNYGVYASAPIQANSYAGYFAGNVTITGTLTNPSDERLKENIKDLDNSLPLILKLKPKTYSYINKDEFSSSLPKGKRMGLIAQDVEDVIPGIVQDFAEPQNDIDKKGTASIAKTFKGVDYLSLIPVLIGAIQEQQKQIDNLTKEVNTLKGKY